ncbi:Trihelix transcription factor PTL [Striga hermonthica]|uniref:Trihelix transcription factor PTL n=1 Tax=Striga hermonthica TaxID=68872 RepID=A0A9N7RRD1_STRHE|nr:Trihelix transcription factor PTL [Striga hermonthica]
MEDNYGMAADLRPYVAVRPLFPATAATQQPAAHPYYVLDFCPDDYSAPPPYAAVGTIGAVGFVAEVDGGGRWPRQETLSLLEVRTRLDARFKEANQKGPLWDELSRIMYDEYGYQRTGKKCREKFENLYKYYKKTKGGKSGRQDGKHYRFFRQLEALYGDQASNSNNNNNNHSSASVSHQTHYANFTYDYSKTANPFANISNNNNNQESLASLVSFSNSSDFDTIVTSEDESAELDLLEIHAKNPSNKKKMFKENSFKAEIKDSIDIQMKKIVEKQEAWMEKMTRIIDKNEKERISREEQWRKQDAERVEREQRMWANEKAWILARDAALIEAYGKLAGKDSRVSRQEEEPVVESQNEGLKVDWNGHVASWDWSGDCFSKWGKKRMGPYHVGPVVEGQGFERGVNSSRDEFSYFSGSNAYGRNA